MGSNTSGTCSHPSDWGPCQQPAGHGPHGWCSAHTRWALHPDHPVDKYYHRKVVLNLVQPTWDWMSEAEADTLLNGRYRGDGRRLDAWVSGAEPLMIDPEGL